nr:AraC family transcriptional regulator [Paenibacillus hemerocallicola]
MAEIARQVGYEDALYFTRVFSKSIGMTPRAFRNG